MTLNPATTDAFRNIAVVEGSFPEATTTTVAAEIVGDTLTITGGFGITITADPLTDSIVINNTGDAVGAYTEITEANANETYYPVFSRPIDQTPFNTNPVTGEHQLDTLYVDFTTTPMSYNPSTSTLTASTFVGNLTGNADTVTNGVYTNGSYSDPTWLSISQSFVGLGNVTNESKATMFTSPTFTGHPTIEGVTSTGATGSGNLVFSGSPTFTGTVDLSSIRTSATNLTIESGIYGGDPGFTRSKIELTTNGFNDYVITNPNYTHRFFVGSTHTFSIPGTVGSDGWALTTDGAGTCTWTQITATTVGLENVTNESKATMFTSPTFTGHPTIEGVTSTGATGTGNLVFSASPTFTGTVSGITQTMVGLSNVTNESKATMFTDSTFTGTTNVETLQLTNPLGISYGGTGANNTSDALNNLLPSGEVSGYVLKTSGAGSYYWAAETGASTVVGTRIDTSRVTYTATANQTEFTGVGTYTIGTGQLRVYIDGVRQNPDAYTESSTTSFTLSAGVPAGTKVLAEVDGYLDFTVVANAVTFSPVGGIAATDVQSALAELDTEKAPLASPTFTGHPTIEGVTLTGATGTGNLVFSASPTFTGTVSGITSSMVGLGNVTNESKATMFANSTLTGTTTIGTVLFAANGFSITQSGTKIIFAYNGTTVMSIDSSGNMIAKANITAYGTP